MSPRLPPGPRTLAAGLLLALLVSSAPGAAPARQQASPPSPAEFFGFPMGAEGRLADWTDTVAYVRELARLSDRVRVVELGPTTLGRPFVMAVASSPETLDRLDEHRAMQHRLADPRSTPPDAADRIAREGKAVVLIGASVHSDEIGGSQMANELLYRLATDESPWMTRVLDNVIVLLVPSQNPDGHQMLVDWHEANLGTPFEGSPLPELYHPYAGHDLNRDAFMLTQLETRHLARVLYQDWLPEVYLDVHQMGNSRARIFVPPYKNPANPNVDPLIWTESNILGQTMAARLQEGGRPGVIWGETYTGYWQGANSTNPWWHNIVGMLSEVASARLTMTVHQEAVTLDRPMGELLGRGGRTYPPARDGVRPIPAPSDVQPRINYPDPWLGGTWTFADVVDYQLQSTLGLLEGVANNRALLKRNFYAMNRRAIERFADGDPYAFLVPREQGDRASAARLLQLLQAGGVEIHRAVAPFTADGVVRPAGTYVVQLAQPFGRWAKDLLEAQRYPDIRWPHPSVPLDRPYDVAGWTLGMLMGVETAMVTRPFTADLEIIERAVAPASAIEGDGTTYVIGHESNQSLVATGRLLASGARVDWARDALDVAGRAMAPGALVVRGTTRAALGQALDGLSLEAFAIDPLDAPSGWRMSPPRIAVFEPWGGNIDAGWTRWVLDQHELSYTVLRGPEVGEQDLRQRYDVIVFPEARVSEIVRGNQGSSIRPEHRGALGSGGVGRVRQFVADGGTVVTLGNAAEFAVQVLGAPARSVIGGARRDRFFCPGSLLRITVDPTHPVGFGMPANADAMFVDNDGYVPLGPAEIVARYPERSLLRSGWIIGEAELQGAGAVLEVPSGRGRIIMLTFRVQHRGQTWGTFKLLLNSLYYATATEPGRPEDLTAQPAGR